MTKVNLNNGNETLSDIFPWDIFKSDSIYFFIKIYLYISTTFKIGILSFMTKVNSYNGNETMKTYSNLTPFFIRAYESVSMTFKIDISQFYD